VGKDVTEILGYQNGSRDINQYVDDDDRINIDGKTQSQFGIELGQRGGWLINESGLYSLILSSKLSKEKKLPSKSIPLLNRL
jgi:antirepressor